MHTYIKSSKNGYRSITYIMSDKKGQEVERIADFYADGGILDTGNPSTICEQFSRIWRLGKRDIGSIQGYTIVYAFSENEIAPDDPDGPHKAIELVRDIEDNLRPDTQRILVAQRDGKSGLLHVHAFDSALHTSTLKALSGRETSQTIMYSLAQEKMEQHGIEFDAGKNHKKKKENTGAKRKAYQKKTEGNSWVEDVERRIDAAVSETLKTSDLEQNLRAHGIGVSRKTKSGWTFVLLESEESKYLGKKVAYSKLSDDYSMKSLNEKIRLNFIQSSDEQKKELEAQRKAEEAKRLEAEAEAKRQEAEREEAARREQEKTKREAQAVTVPTSGRISLDDSIRHLAENKQHEVTKVEEPKKVELTPQQKFNSEVERLYEIARRGTDDVFMSQCKNFHMKYPHVSIQEQLNKYAERMRMKKSEELRARGISSNPDADALKRYPDVVIEYERREPNVNTRVNTGYDYQKEF